MNKNTKIIVGVVAVLVVAVAVFAFINRGNILSRMELQEDGAFLVTAHGETTNVSMDTLAAIGHVDVTASPRGEDRHFTGVSLSAIFSYLGIDYSGADSVVFTSEDGFTSAIDADEITGNAFIVFEEDGEAIETGFMVVMAEDPFPNRWARYLLEVTLQ